LKNKILNKSIIDYKIIRNKHFQFLLGFLLIVVMDIFLPQNMADLKAIYLVIGFYYRFLSIK